MECLIFGKMFCFILSSSQFLINNPSNKRIFPFFREQLHQFDRLKTLINSQASSYANSVHESGHTFAVMHSASQYGPVDQLSESLFGLTQVNRMQGIARLDQLDDIVDKCAQIAKHVLTKSSLR